MSRRIIPSGNVIIGTVDNTDIWSRYRLDAPYLATGCSGTWRLYPNMVFALHAFPLVRLGIVRYLVGEGGDDVPSSSPELSPPLSPRYLTHRPVLDDHSRVQVLGKTSHTRTP